MRRTKRFDIGDVLSVSTGFLVSERGIQGVYELMGWILGDDGITTIGIAMEQSRCAGFLWAEFPDLRNLRGPQFDPGMEVRFKKDACREWVDAVAAALGKRDFDVPQVPPDMRGAPDIGAQIGYVRERNPNAQIVGIAP